MCICMCAWWQIPGTRFQEMQSPMSAMLIKMKYFNNWEELINHNSWLCMVIFVAHHAEICVIVLLDGIQMQEIKCFSFHRLCNIFSTALLFTYLQIPINHYFEKIESSFVTNIPCVIQIFHCRHYTKIKGSKVLSYQDILYV